MAKPLEPFLFDTNNLYGNVSCGRILFQVIEHGPAEHIGQENIEHNRQRLKLVSQRAHMRPVGRDDPLQALFPDQAEQDLGEMGIVLNEELDVVEPCMAARSNVGRVILQNVNESLTEFRATPAIV